MNNNTMKAKMTTIPFDVGKAKQIQNGSLPGRIVTRDGRDVLIVDWNSPESDAPLTAVQLGSDLRMHFYCYKADGTLLKNADEFNLMLQVPEWARYKNGDVVYCVSTDSLGDTYKWVALIKDISSDFVDKYSPSIDTYASLSLEGKDKGQLLFDEVGCYADFMTYAFRSEKKKLVDALEASDEERAKEVKNLFFYSVEEDWGELCPFQTVLVRDSESDTWKIDLFSHKLKSGKFQCLQHAWTYCIAYCDMTKHLLATTHNWEEE